MKKIIILIFITTILSCNTEEEYNYTNEENANEITRPYFVNFKEEAFKRGYDFSDYKINFFLADIENDHVGGLSYSGNKIIIDRTNWNNSSSQYKEWLIFHELGHYLLNREHKNLKSNSGECLSYMRSGENGDDCFQNLYSSKWRQYYIDELFNGETSLPNWYSNNVQYKIDYQNKIEIFKKTDLYTNFFNESIKLDTISRFVFEVTFKDWQSIANIDSELSSLISLNGVYFNSQPESDRSNIIIRNSTDKRFFEKDQYSFKKDIKFTVRKNLDIYQFFLDEQLLHITDINSFDNNNLVASFSSEIYMDIQLFEYLQ